MKRWIIRPLQQAKRGLTSLFVCTIVLSPLLLVVFQWSHAFGNKSHDNRKVTPLAALTVRPIDAHNPSVKPFQEPLITVTFDDGWESVYTQAMPLLQQYGIPTTQYILSGVEQDPGYMSFDQIRAIHTAGHEITCHSVSHPDLTTLSKQDLFNQLTGCKSTLQQKIGVNAKDFASPYGHNNPQSIAAIKQVYRSQRNTDGDLSNGADYNDVNLANNFSVDNITGVSIRRDTTEAQLSQAIDYTIKHNGWLVLNYHQVDDGNSKFGIDSKVLDQQLSYVGHAPVRIVTMSRVLDALQPQTGGQ